MKKGELKRQKILQTAESLFCRYGYETTSIQDILDMLHTSKGSFYHHFVSKEALLEEICRNRVSSANAQLSRIGISGGVTPAAKLNRLFSDMIPFSGEKLTFLMMIIRVFDLPEGNSLRNFYTKELTERYLPDTAAILQEGIASGWFICSDSSFFAEISLQLVNGLWLKICDLILQYERQGCIADSSDIMKTVGLFRLTLERLLGAPFGSLDLIRLTELQTLTEQIHMHWNKQ